MEDGVKMTCCYKGCALPVTTSSLLCAEHSLTEEGQLVDKAAAMLMDQLVRNVRAELLATVAGSASPATPSGSLN